MVILWHTQSPQSSHTTYFWPSIRVWPRGHSRSNKGVLSIQGTKNEENWLRISKRDNQKDSASKYKASNNKLV